MTNENDAALEVREPVEKKKPVPVTREDVEKYRAERRGLEVDVLDEVLLSRRRAWQVASGFGALAAVAFIMAGGTVLRYSQPIPEHMLWMNKDTGEVQQVALMRGETTYGDVIDSYWVSRYVVHHESYDFYSAQADYDAVGLMSSGQVADDYQQRYRGTDAMDKRLGDSENTVVHVTSVILDREHGIATVRYTTTKKYRQRPLPEPTQYWIATVAYKYVVSPMTATQRYINPLGFCVTSFRTNAESVGKVGG
jgi:type IV secretion system protein VirB8